MSEVAFEDVTVDEFLRTVGLANHLITLTLTLQAAEGASELAALAEVEVHGQTVIRIEEALRLFDKGVLQTEALEAEAEAGRHAGIRLFGFNCVVETGGQIEADVVADLQVIGAAKVNRGLFVLHLLDVA
ncbi:MAG: hypothetical protein IPG71_07895 [bacterium]|nr:hypothetical protein [bacterium]